MALGKSYYIDRVNASRPFFVSSHMTMLSYEGGGSNKGEITGQHNPSQRSGFEGCAPPIMLLRKLLVRQGIILLRMMNQSSGFFSLSMPLANPRLYPQNCPSNDHLRSTTADAPKSAPLSTKAMAASSRECSGHELLKR